MKEFFKKIWNWIKTKAKEFWEWLKSVFLGVKWISKEQWEEGTQAIIKNRYSTWEQMDKDNDGWITTKDIKDWFDEKHQLENREEK